MNTANKVANAIKWIDGLLVTRYKQGKNMLGNKEIGFCCLGYGCHILDIDYSYAMGFNSDFAENVGLNHEEGLFLPSEPSGRGVPCSSIGGLNDQAGWTFNQIAKFMISRDFSMFEDNVAGKLVEHYKRPKLGRNSLYNKESQT